MSQYQASMEAIAFQIGKDLPKALATIFQKLIDVKADGEEADKACAEVASLIMSAMGLNTPVKLFERASAASRFGIMMLDPNFNAYSPINPKATALIEKYDLTTLVVTDILKGSIDRKNCRVTGVYSTIPFPIGIPKSMFDGGYTAGEITAIFGHEVGHAWNICEFLGQSLITNFIMAEVVGRMDMQTEENRKFALGRVALKLAGNDQKIPPDINSAEITALVLEGQVKRMQRDYNTRWYDRRLSETMADHFSARWGLGANLVSALSKMERSKGWAAEGGFDNVWVGLLSNAMTVALLPFGVALSGGVAAAGLAILRKIAIGFSLSFLISGTTYGLSNDSYPPMETRMRNIRNQLVSLLKDKTLSKEEREQALSDIAVIDAELNNIHPFSNVMSQLSNYVLDVVSGKHQAIVANQMKENLANNRLFEFSAMLK